MAKFKTWVKTMNVRGAATALMTGITMAIALTVPNLVGASEKLVVATTFTILADMTRNVGGNTVTVVSVTKPGAEIHNYKPTPKDIGRTRSADLVLWNGLNLELWFEKFLSRLNGVPHVILSDGVSPMSINNGPYDGKPNPHVWMSPTDALTYVDNIEKALSLADPDNANLYASNAAAYKDDIVAIVEPLRKRLADIPKDKRWLVSSEGAFSYLARDFDLNELYLWPINADSQGTPKQVKNVIDTMRSENIPVIFSESTVSPKPAQQVARETGAHYGGVLYVDSLSKEDGPVPTYLDLLKVTIETLIKGIETGMELQR